jgi:hypothetical protein
MTDAPTNAIILPKKGLQELLRKQLTILENASDKTGTESNPSYFSAPLSAIDESGELFPDSNGERNAW